MPREGDSSRARHHPQCHQDLEGAAELHECQRPRSHRNFGPGGIYPGRYPGPIQSFEQLEVAEQACVHAHGVGEPGAAHSGIDEAESPQPSLGGRTSDVGLPWEGDRRPVQQQEPEVDGPSQQLAGCCWSHATPAPCEVGTHEAVAIHLAHVLRQGEAGQQEERLRVVCASHLQHWLWLGSCSPRSKTQASSCSERHCWACVQRGGHSMGFVRMPERMPSLV